MKMQESPKTNVPSYYTCITQCENFSICLSLRFYVKSILENIEVLKTVVFAILGALNLGDLVNFSLQKVKKSQNSKFRTPQLNVHVH